VTSTLGIKKIQYPNGTNSITIDSSGSAAITTANITTAAITTANVTNATATGTITTPSINGSQIGGRRNMIINGAMQVNQRGATSGVTSGYFVDRFTLSGCSASAVITSSTPTEFPTAITVSATSGNPIIIQKIESNAVQHLSGKTVTASFLAKNVSNATTLYVSLAYAGSADNWGSSTTISEQNLGALTGDWVKYTASWTVPAGGLNGLGLNILCAGSSTFTMGVAGVQLEVGSQATAFEHRSFGEELSLCERYFERWNSSGGNESLIAVGYVLNSGRILANYKYNTPKRVDPTGTNSGASGFSCLRGSWHTATSFVILGNKHTARIDLTGLSGFTAGYAAEVRAEPGAGKWFAFDAEL